MQPRTALKPILILRKALQPKTEKNLVCSGVYRGPAAKSAPDCQRGGGRDTLGGRGSDWAASGAGGGEVGDSLQSGPGRIYPQRYGFMVKTLAYTVNNPEA
eukprot:scaffold12442_cov69-Phaeocystis_antarctica.AAC.1